MKHKEPVQVRVTYDSSWELMRYELDLVGEQDIRWDKGGTVRAGDYIFFYGKGKENLLLGTGLFVFTTE